MNFTDPGDRDKYLNKKKKEKEEKTIQEIVRDLLERNNVLEQLMLSANSIDELKTELIKQRYDFDIEGVETIENFAKRK